MKHGGFLSKWLRLVTLASLCFCLPGHSVLAAGNTPPGTANLVRVDNRTLNDQSGPFLGLGASYFQALRRAKFDRARFENDLKFLASKKFNYVRVLSMVGWFQAWDGIEIAPIDFESRGGKKVAAWPDYWKQFGEMIDIIYRHGMRTEITIFADAQLMPDKSDRVNHMATMLEHLKGREHKVILLEVANEAWQNGFPGKEGTVQLREFASFLNDRTQIPIAITSNHEEDEAGAVELYRGSAADIATWHFSRDIRTVEGGWLPVRDCYRFVNIAGLPPFSSNEPIGPGSSVSSENDPIKLVMAAAFAWTAGLPMYVYHSSAGVFGKVPFEKMAGIEDHSAVLKILPGDLPAWTPHDGKGSNAPFTTYANNLPDKWWPEVKGATNGVVCHTGANQPDGKQFVSLPIGVLKGGVTLQAKRAMKLNVYHPLDGTVITNNSLDTGTRFWLPQGPGAYIIRGEYTATP